MENFDCTRTPETMVLKQDVDILRGTEKHNCSLQAGFCSWIFISHQTFSSFDALPHHDTCSSVEVMRAGSTQVNGHGRIWEVNVSQFWFFTPKLTLPTDRSTHKEFVQRLGLLHRHHLATALLIFLPCGAATWLYVVPLAGCCGVFLLTVDF